MTVDFAELLCPYGPWACLSAEIGDKLPAFGPDETEPTTPPMQEEPLH